MAKKAEERRCVTGIEGLDRIIGGGLPVGGTILVSGICGSGKSALGIEFLVRGALMGQRSILISTVHSAEKLMMSVPPLDFFDKKIVETGMLKMIEIEEVMKFAKVEHQLIDIEGAMQMLASIKSIITNGSVKRLVIDSTTPLLMEMEQSAGREFLKGLANLLYERKCTGILVSETSQIDGFETVVADGIITLGNFERRGDILRVIQVVKMSGAAHSRSRYVTDTTSLGLLLTPMLRGL
ncbi:MAG: ATPase domain-containing protein [Methanomassiliicoccales archaeon]